MSTTEVPSAPSTWLSCLEMIASPLYLSAKPGSAPAGGNAINRTGDPGGITPEGARPETSRIPTTVWPVCGTTTLATAPAGSSDPPTRS